MSKRVGILVAVSLVSASAAVVKPAGYGYEVRAPGLDRPVLAASVAAKVDGAWLRAKEYPRSQQAESAFQDDLGSGRQVTIAYAGVSGKPDLLCVLRNYGQLPLATIEVLVRNSTAKPVNVQAIRVIEAGGVSLGGPMASNRVLTDSFSENRPVIRIYDFNEAPGGSHWGSNSQLVYNRESRQSLFLGAVTSRRFLTVFTLRADSYTVDSTGTTEVHTHGGLLARAPAEDRIELSLPVAPGQELASERVSVAAGNDYHSQLENYGNAVRVLMKARVSGENLIGWWSWTALYSGLSEGTARTNAEYLAEHLKKFGYEYFHMDEGYQYARGDYTVPDAARFPNGVRPLAHDVARMGLKLGVWTAPFEISHRSSIYREHPDWLVHNAASKPIVVASEVTGADRMYALDTTHPGAQQYLRQTYQTLAREWGACFIKMDFMDDTTIEGYYHRPHTTAMEAQQIGLAIIREAVGDKVHLDKDGSPMLNPVGYVDEGRISVDTAHSFPRIKRALPGIAGRYFMNRNFFVSDPDGFVLSRQTIGETGSQTTQLAFNEAQVSIALALISGGMFEIGDDLPSLAADPDRLALLTNRELLRMAKLSHASVPLDLMAYQPEDEQPGIFLLRESPRQSVLTIFNWTDRPRPRKLSFADLKLPAGRAYQVHDILDGDKPFAVAASGIVLDNQPPRSVRMLKIVDTEVPAAPPAVALQAPENGSVAKAISFSAAADHALSYAWDFGDGTATTGAKVNHTYTRAGDFTVAVAVEGVDGLTTRKTARIHVTGEIKTPFPLSDSRPYIEK